MVQVGNYALDLVDLNSPEDMTQARPVYIVNATSPGKEKTRKGMERKEKNRTEKKGKEKKGKGQKGKEQKRTVNASSPGIHLLLSSQEE